MLRRGEKSIPSIKAVNRKVKELTISSFQGDPSCPLLSTLGSYHHGDIEGNGIRIRRHTAGGCHPLVFLGNVRAAIMTALVIPISLAVTLAVMTITGDSANLLSIGAIDFGIIADIALVLTENYIRVARKYGPNGVSGERRSGKGHSSGRQRRLGTPIILLVCIIVIAFIPIFTMKGARNRYFRRWLKTYTYALLFTLLLT